MQISAINTAFKANISSHYNPGRIKQLEQKRLANQWPSEGCTGGLNEQDNRELILRKEYQTLLDKHAALQWASEGCNGSLSARDITRMNEIRTELLSIKEEQQQAPVEATCDCPQCNSASPEPGSAYYRDWAY